MAQLSFLIYFPILFSMIISLKPSLAATYFDHECSNTTMFASNSRYQTNLNTLFQDLASNTTNRYGYHNATSGVGTNDVVYGNFLCRGDQSKSSCQACVITATMTDLPVTYCPNRKLAAIWYDECMVRYSNESFFGILDRDYEYFVDSESQNVTGNVTQFTDIMDDMMINIASRASGGGSDIKYGTGAVEYSSLGTVYGLVQCTPDLSNYDCKECLVGAISTFPICKGARYVRYSCNAQFETYSFFNGNATLTGTIPSSPAPPPTSNATGTGTGTGTVIFSPSSTPSRNSGKSKTSAKVIAIAVSFVLLSAVLVAITVCFVVRRRKIKQNGDAAHQTIEEDLTTRESLLYDMATLQTATNEFSKENKLGEGGYGSVYKGTLSNGEEVAVKRLSRSSLKSAQEFKNEILLVAKLHHKNLARLLGFALNEKEKLLVYEYVPNKSLEHFVFDPVKQGQLNWRLRYNIILGIAKGMLYLHQDSGLKIIHRDLKASNILLDADMNPKIADFGLARMFDYDKSQSKTSRLVGTYGYMSPEYVMHGIYSTKSDVYSYGVLILEIISGKINSAFPEASYGDNLVTYAWKLWQEGNSLAFVDASVRDSCSSDEVMKCVHLSLLCVQEAVEARPTMATVVLTLESNNNVSLPVPRQPGFFNKTEKDPNFGNYIGVTHSSNDVSVSGIEPR